MNGCAPSLALIERLKATRKWAIHRTIVARMIQIAMRDRTVNMRLCYATVEIRSNGRRPKGDDSGKRSFPYEARSAESKKRDKG